MAQEPKFVDLSGKFIESLSAMRALIRFLLETKSQTVSLAKMKTALTAEYPEDIKRKMHEAAGGIVGTYGIEDFLNSIKAHESANKAFYKLFRPVLAKLIRQNIKPESFPDYIRCCIATVYEDSDLVEYALPRSDANDILDYTRLSQAAFDVVSRRYKGLWWVYRLSTQNTRLHRGLIETPVPEKTLPDRLLDEADRTLVNKMLLRIQPKVDGLSPRFTLYSHSSATPTRTPTKSVGLALYMSDRIYFIGHNDLGEVHPMTHLVLMTWQHVTEEADTQSKAEHKGLFRAGTVSLLNSTNQHVIGYLHASRIPATAGLDEDKTETQKNGLKEEVRLHTLGDLLRNAPPDEHDALCAMVRNSATDLVYYVGGNR
ncbi:MAG: hypothetical protein GC191_08300 [Azospirillum sp.]|nr:hypothetical protein [Azospirillum sp.]